MKRTKAGMILEEKDTEKMVDSIVPSLASSIS